MYKPRENYSMKKRFAVITAMALCATSFGAVAADDFPFKSQIKARQSFMQIYAFNLGLLGAMAKGTADYDAKLASAAANNLLAAANMDNTAMWPMGSDADAEGLDGKTRAKPEAWSNYPELAQKQEDLNAALATMVAEAGNGLDAVQANMGAVGKGCKGCHESFRVPKDE
jgi:cytochrome c556